MLQPLYSALARRVLPALLALAALGAAHPLRATSYVMISDAALADQATVIVDARVTAVEPAAVYDQAPSTDYRVEVERVLKGDVPGGVIVVRVPGGVDPATASVSKSTARRSSRRTSGRCSSCVPPPTAPITCFT
jgi:hypothetical protein